MIRFIFAVHSPESSIQENDLVFEKEKIVQIDTQNHLGKKDRSEAEYDERGVEARKCQTLLRRETRSSATTVPQTHLSADAICPVSKMTENIESIWLNDDSRRI